MLSEIYRAPSNLTMINNKTYRIHNDLWKKERSSYDKSLPYSLQDVWDRRCPLILWRMWLSLYLRKEGADKLEIYRNINVLFSSCSNSIRTIYWLIWKEKFRLIGRKQLFCFPKDFVTCGAMLILLQNSESPTRKIDHLVVELLYLKQSDWIELLKMLKMTEIKHGVASIAQIR